jgi:23S rRNA pseudouridine1911/1915/1917 synthase
VNTYDDAAEGVTRLLVLPEHETLRLDQYLAAATLLSRRAARKLITEGAVARNGRPSRVLGRLVETADVVDVLRPPADLGVPPRPMIDELEILFEDRWLLALHKPAGMLSQPGSGSEPELSLDLAAMLQLAARDGLKPYLRLVHRLDRLTSGVALCARNPQAHAPLAAAWAEGKVDRRYLAVVHGTPPVPTIDLDPPIARDPNHTWRFRVAPSGRSAITQVRVLANLDEELSLVECRLRTGRTHQVRVHLAHWGHPVVGDRLYGSRRAEWAQRPLLHASAIELPHPKNGSPIRISASPPADMARFLTEAADSL